MGRPLPHVEDLDRNFIKHFPVRRETPVTKRRVKVKSHKCSILLEKGL